LKEILYKGEKADVYVLPCPYLHSFCIGVYLVAGSLYEDIKENGITHLYEHCVFRSIKKKYPSDFYELLTENSISFNASTYKEFVYFEISGLPSGIDLAADIVAKLFDPIELTGAEFQTEKKRIKAEIREESEFTTLQYFADTKVWENTSLANTISGYCGTLDKISLKAINKFRDDTVTKGNVFLYVTGNVSALDIEKIRCAASSMNIGKGGRIKDNVAPVPRSFGARPCEIHFKQSDFCLVRMSFDIDNDFCDTAVRDVLYSALFEGEDALFFQRMSEREPLIYSYDSTLEQYRNISSIKFQYEISSKNLERSFEAVVSILEDIKRGAFRFDNSVKKLSTKWALMRDEAANLNWGMAYMNRILGNTRLELTKDGTSLYKDVKLEAVKEKAAEIFIRKNLVCAVKGKKKSVDTEKLNIILDGLDG